MLYWWDIDVTCYLSVEHEWCRCRVSKCRVALVFDDLRWELADMTVEHESHIICATNQKNGHGTPKTNSGIPLRINIFHENKTEIPPVTVWLCHMFSQSIHTVKMSWQVCTSFCSSTLLFVNKIERFLFNDLCNATYYYTVLTWRQLWMGWFCFFYYYNLPPSPKGYVHSVLTVLNLCTVNSINTVNMQITIISTAGASLCLQSQWVALQESIHRRCCFLCSFTSEVLSA